MVRFLSLQVIFCALLFGTDIIVSAEALSNNASETHKIFTNPNLFINEKGFIKTKDIVDKLRQNGLFDEVSFGSPSLNLKFVANDKILPALFIKAVNSSLNAMGASVARINEVSNLATNSYS
ncbi:MAG: hypothetical protein LUC34_06170, partial [Campylobacter sp.]|nr:hypothetical protein [Campylobacter sp.]